MRMNCPVCQNSNITIFLKLRDVPILCNQLWDSPEAARKAPKGDIHLSFCPECTHIFNAAFNPDLIKYSDSYENSLHYSSVFQKYAEDLAKNLVKRYNLFNKNIIEIGCGQGEFLKLLCNLGNNKGIGFDPGVRINETNSKVTFIKDYFSEKYLHFPADLICCRHVLEHLYNPLSFLKLVKKPLKKSINPVLFIEVPSILFIMQDLSIWDIIYEHFSYFSPFSLAKLFINAGFRILSINRVYSNQFITIEASFGNNELFSNSKEVIINYDLIRNFKIHFQRKISFWQKRLNQFSKFKQKMVIWGAGSKGITFLNHFKLKDVIEYVVDINPRKQNKFIPVTGQKIVPPEYLIKYKPDVVFIMNKIYKNEIKNRLQKLQLKPELITV